jgi:hypothetical protein
MIGDDTATSMFEYTLRTRTKEILVGLDQVAFLRSALPRLSEQPVRFTYHAGGAPQARSLEHGEILVLSLTAAERRALNLVVTEGTLGVTSSFLSPFDGKSAPADQDVSISRTYNGEPGPIKLGAGDLVRIELTYRLGDKALDGCYQVTDLLPSGLRPVLRLYERGITDPDATYPYDVEGQRVSFCADRADPQRPIVYYARVIGTGTYKAEPTLVQSQLAPERVALTPTMSVEIR